ncbi:flagellar biosynthesis protein FlgJ [Ideonella sp. B7]|uniref:flagellar biosynthesis protein FlgJ n=1 Tax=Ideonella benzenivorans TaxID=2831643 RepID=UPI001CEC2F89|nr:flagellar biosynthesis protein FlgJ [Ideonella benzenivorans]MCA6217231.1 flagellar biosynthesis protein FlgJ [Ideonella benzenivorans]
MSSPDTPITTASLGATSPTDPLGLNTIRPALDSDAATAQAARKAAQQFESHFIAQMLHDMRRSSQALSDPDGSHPSQGQEMLDLADTMVADQLATQGAFGIADLLLRQVLPQDATPPTAPKPAKPA